MVARLRGRPTPRPPGPQPEEESKTITSAHKEGGSNRLLVIITSVSVLAAVGTTSALLYYTVGPGHQPIELNSELPLASTGPAMDMGPFIVNLGNVNDRRYLRIGLSLDFQTRDPHYVNGNEDQRRLWVSELKAQLKKVEPIFQDVVVTSLSAKSPEELGSAAGKEELKAELIAKLNRHMPASTAVQNVYLTNFVIQ